MKFQIPDKSKDKRKLDMTPLIDCVFQLLLFFLVASHFEEQARMTNEGELEAALPEAAAAMPMTMKPQELIVNINAVGQFYVAGNLETEPALAQRLQQAQLNNPGNQSVVIRGDETADWKYIARVMSLCNQANIRDYRVAVVKENEVSGDGL